MNRLILIAAFVVTSASLAQTAAPTPSAAQETASAPGDGQPCAPEFGMTPTEIFTDCAPLKVRGPLFAEEIFTRDGSSYFKATDEVTVKVNTQTTPPVASKPLVSVTNSICFLTGDSRHGNRSTCWINENNGMRYLNLKADGTDFQELWCTARCLVWGRRPESERAPSAAAAPAAPPNSQ